MDEFQSEKEQIEEIKQWWKQNGTFITTGLILGVLVLGGYKYWSDYKLRRAESASATYEQLLQAVREGDATGADTLAARLDGEFSATPYGAQARLAMVQHHVGTGDFDAAADQLRAIVAVDETGVLAQVARLRLARLLIEQGQPAEALETLGDAEVRGFAARFHDVRGDAYVAMGEPEQARREYQSALDKYQPGLLDRQLVEMKLGDLAEASPEA